MRKKHLAAGRSYVRNLVFGLFALGYAVQGYAGINGDDPVTRKLGYQLQLRLEQIQAQSNKDDRLAVLIYLDETPDLSEMNAHASFVERTRSVYDALRHAALKSQKEITDWLDQEKVTYRAYYLGNVIAAENFPVQLVQRLVDSPAISMIRLNPSVRLKVPASHLEPVALSALSAPTIEDSLKSVGADKVWQEFNVRGAHIVVAGQDTGIDWQHPALARNYRGYGQAQPHHFNWHDAIHKAPSADVNAAGPCGYNNPVPCDDHGHGSHTMGTMLGNDTQGNILGVAPDAQWIGCRNMDQGVGRASSYIECFEFFLAPYAFGANSMRDGRPDLAAHIINNSWACDASELCEGDEFLPILRALKAAGIMVVASAGNEGPSCETIAAGPAHHSDMTFSVGAINHRNNSIAYFSSRGPSAFDQGIGPDLSAPGVNIRSAMPRNSYGTMSGTSMAGPHVAGAVALLWSADERLIGQIDESITAMTSTAQPTTTREGCGGLPSNAVPNNTFGSGLMNIYQAVKARRSM